MKKRKSYQKWSWIFMVLFITLSIYDIRFGLL
ncbi:MAG TPA: 4Fe-4S ferredoxin, partial [Clostridium sp.]|nr:4Fe-4S ferredoxin [Clostridium sp.]